MTAYTIFKEYIWLMNTIHHAEIRARGQEWSESCSYERKVVSLQTY